MAIIRKTSNWLPSMFNDFFGNEWFENPVTSFKPAINIKQTGKGYTIEVAAPGMTKNDVKVRIDNEENLIIEFMKQEKKEEADDKNCTYLRREFQYSQFKHTMILPENADKDNIKAAVENGVLTVDIPVKEKENEDVSRLIEIN